MPVSVPPTFWLWTPPSFSGFTVVEWADKEFRDLKARLDVADGEFKKLYKGEKIFTLLEKIYRDEKLKGLADLKHEKYSDASSQIINKKPQYRLEKELEDNSIEQKQMDGCTSKSPSVSSNNVSKSNSPPTEDFTSDVELMSGFSGTNIGESASAGPLKDGAIGFSLHEKKNVPSYPAGESESRTIPPCRPKIHLFTRNQKLKYRWARNMNNIREFVPMEDTHRIDRNVYKHEYQPQYSIVQSPTLYQENEFHTERVQRRSSPPSSSPPTRKQCHPNNSDNVYCREPTFSQRPSPTNRMDSYHASAHTSNIVPSVPKTRSSPPTRAASYRSDESKYSRTTSERAPVETMKSHNHKHVPSWDKVVESKKTTTTKKKKKKQANYFIALQITNPSIKKKINSVQTSLKTNHQELSNCMIPAETLHVTLSLLNLPSEADMWRAINAFESFGKSKLQDILPTKTTCRLLIEGVKHRKRVLYCTLADDGAREKLRKIHNALRQHFQDCGIEGEYHKKFEPHLTICRVSNPKTTISPDATQCLNDFSLNFGYQFVHRLDFCQMNVEGKKYRALSKITPRRVT